MTDMTSIILLIQSIGNVVIHRLVVVVVRDAIFAFSFLVGITFNAFYLDTEVLGSKVLDNDFRLLVDLFSVIIGFL
ncbi:unnamed protein product [Pseudo-nitzschia multistriata]|uniref:Uncharacterized protein n=1 Tax=Pseudo-nitzschia multistriata TaxID=183589 RepID=A0A448ZF87_9STRA|nr:unnamed protein product [Pseudo-nitzschia multistriata]